MINTMTSIELIFTSIKLILVNNVLKKKKTLLAFGNIRYCPFLSGTFNHLGHSHLPMKKESEGKAKEVASTEIISIPPLHHDHPILLPLYSPISTRHEDPSFPP